MAIRHMEAQGTPAPQPLNDNPRRRACATQPSSRIAGRDSEIPAGGFAPEPQSCLPDRTPIVPAGGGAFSDGDAGSSLRGAESTSIVAAEL